MEKIKMCVPCHFGLESTLAYEIRKVGGENLSVSDGKITFDGDFNVLARANLWISCGERVLIELGKFKAESFTELFDNVKKLELERFIGRLDAFPVKGYCLKSKLHSVPDCQKIIKKACVSRLEDVYRISHFEETGAKHQIQFSIYKDIACIYLDSTGVGLHKRGYRRNSNEAPIKETLAAGIIDIARVNNNSILIDPMCGSGTFLVESAFKALRVAPGLRRNFVGQTWKQIPQEVWQDARKEALDSIDKKGTFKAYGYDLEERAVMLSTDNARKAGVGSKVIVKQQDISQFTPIKGAVTICNPPYGERMLEIKQAEELYKRMGEKLHPSGENPCYIISPDEQFEEFFGKKADKKRKLYNGMIKCNLYMYFR